MKQLEKTIILAIIIIVTVNFPFIAILDNIKLSNNIPALYLFLYLLWAILIGVYFFTYKKNKV